MFLIVDIPTIRIYERKTTPPVAIKPRYLLQIVTGLSRQAYAATVTRQLISISNVSITILSIYLLIPYTILGRLRL